MPSVLPWRFGRRNGRPARDPPRSAPARIPSRARLLSAQSLMLPGLIGYGLVARPQSAGGALPCLWRLCFGFRCPGCGLSRANSLLVTGAVHEAVAMNWLIVPVWAAALWYFAAWSLTSTREARHG